MPQLIWDRLRSGQISLQVDMPHWGNNSKLKLQESDITDVLVGAVPYATGQGKYGENSEFLVPFERLIEDDHQKAVEPPTGKGWWPVCQIMWKNMHVHMGYHTMEAYQQAVLAGKTKVFVICWYQLMDNGRVLAVWAIIRIIG